MLAGSETTSEADAVLRAAHELCDEHHDVATASVIKNWIDETERRTWFLSEATRSPRPIGSAMDVGDHGDNSRAPQDFIDRVGTGFRTGAHQRDG